MNKKKLVNYLMYEVDDHAHYAHHNAKHYNKHLYNKWPQTPTRINSIINTDIIVHAQRTAMTMMQLILAHE
jgi:hypothetical protein